MNHPMKMGYRLERRSALALLAAGALGCSNDITWLDELAKSARGAGSGDTAANACRPAANPGAPGDINVDLSTTFQRIRGFGGINVPGWIPDLTPEQVDTA